MITLKQWMEVADYRITEGSDYFHSKYPDAYSFSSWNGCHDGYSLEIVFQMGKASPEEHLVYEVSAHDYKNNRSYRFIHPEFRNKDHDEDEEAWDGVKFTDLDVAEDWIEKAVAIKSGIEYDTRVKIPLELDEKEMMVLFKLAHEADVSLNQYVEMILKKALGI
jgi:hypothetical protein